MSTTITKHFHLMYHLEDTYYPTEVLQEPTCGSVILTVDLLHEVSIETSLSLISEETCKKFTKCFVAPLFC